MYNIANEKEKYTSHLSVYLYVMYVSIIANNIYFEGKYNLMCKHGML